MTTILTNVEVSQVTIDKLLKKHNLKVEIRDVGRYPRIGSAQTEWMKNIQECVYLNGSWITLYLYIKSQLENDTTVLKSITL